MAAQHVGIAPDSLVGIVSIVGTSFERHIVLRSGNLSTTIATSTADSAGLSRVGGIEVVVRGRSETSVFHATSFVVQRVEGVPVVDGVIREDGDWLVLETEKGRRVFLGNPPAPLRGMVGARVWIGGPLDTGPNSYGVIVPAP
jgi:hypothetical protein